MQIQSAWANVPGLHCTQGWLGGYDAEFPSQPRCPALLCDAVPPFCQGTWQSAPCVGKKAGALKACVARCLASFDDYAGCCAWQLPP